MVFSFFGRKQIDDLEKLRTENGELSRRIDRLTYELSEASSKAAADRLQAHSVDLSGEIRELKHRLTVHEDEIAATGKRIADAADEKLRQKVRKARYWAMPLVLILSIAAYGELTIMADRSTHWLSERIMGIEVRASEESSDKEPNPTASGLAASLAGYFGSAFDWTTRRFFYLYLTEEDRFRDVTAIGSANEFTPLWARIETNFRTLEENLRESLVIEGERAIQLGQLHALATLVDAEGRARASEGIFSHLEALTNQYESMEPVEMEQYRSTLHLLARRFSEDGDYTRALGVLNSMHFGNNGPSGFMQAISRDSEPDVQHLSLYCSTVIGHWAMNADARLTGRNIPETIETDHFREFSAPSPACRIVYLVYGMNDVFESNLGSEERANALVDWMAQTRRLPEDWREMFHFLTKSTSGGGMAFPPGTNMNPNFEAFVEAVSVVLESQSGSMSDTLGSATPPADAPERAGGSSVTVIPEEGPF